MKKIKIILALFILYLFILGWQNKENILSLIDTYIYNKPYDAIPSNSYVIEKINNISDQYIPNNNNYSFIDFGSGDGMILKNMYRKYKKLYGIELYEKAHILALQNCKNINNIYLINDSMENFKFPNDDIILYMYDPLFTINDCNKIKFIYNSVINNLNKTNKNKYIIYVQANTIHNLTKNKCHDIIFDIFKNNNYYLLKKTSSNLWPLNRSIYIYKYMI